MKREELLPPKLLNFFVALAWFSIGGGVNEALTLMGSQPRWAFVSQMFIGSVVVLVGCLILRARASMLTTTGTE